MYLKTLGGLRRVHAILRRLDDDFCDPVELRADSALGVPGLIGVVRAGRVVHGECLGQRRARIGRVDGIHARGRASGCWERSCELPSVATWWCGEPAALQYVLKNIERLVIKPTYPKSEHSAGIRPRPGAATSAMSSIERLNARPHAYVAQERLAFSQAPVWGSAGGGGGGAQVQGFPPAPWGSAFMPMATPSGYRVMPGGLARIAADTADIVSMQRGGGSKDVWVLGAGSPLDAMTRSVAGAGTRSAGTPR